MWTALAHIPLKENWSRLQTTEEPMPHPMANSLGDPSLDTGNSGSQTLGDSSPHDQTVTTDPDSFGIYQVYVRKPLHDPLQPTTLNMHCNAHIEDSSLSTNHRPETGMQATSYYCPFSSLLAMAMMVAHHLGGPVQSNDKTTKFVHTLGSLGFNLNPVDLCNFDATLENRKLNAYLAGAPDSMFPHEDG